MGNHFPWDIDKLSPEAFGEFWFRGIVVNRSPPEQIVRHHRDESEGVIGFHFKTWKVFKIIAVLLFSDKVLSVSSFVVKFNDTLIALLCEIKVGDNTIVLPGSVK